ncbi:MAG TPA: succinate dehydrogenase cytochrome b subunit [Abditibacteriaceae bacterium]
MSKLKRATSTGVGKKFLSAISGVALTLFLITHLLGNLTIFKGRGELFNAYAGFLGGLPGISIASLAIVAILLFHAYTGYRVWSENKQARPQEYYAGRPTGSDRSRKTFASTTMMLSGFIVVAFTIVHIWHFKYGMIGAEHLQDKAAMSSLTAPRADDPAGQTAEALTGGDTTRGGAEAMQGNPQEEHHNLAGLVLSEFKKPWVSLFYLVSLAFVGLHVSHGISSAFQSMGAGRLSASLRMAGRLFTILLIGGFMSIPLWVMFFRR